MFNNKKRLGLLKLEPNEKDYNLGIFGDYKPLNERKSLPTISIRNQMYNTCTMNSGVVIKEIDEGVKLSVRFLVAMMKKLGYVAGDGYANLRNIQIVLQKYGCCEEELLPSENRDMSWEEYSTPIITQEMMDNAAKHKSASFWKLNSKFDAFKAIDEGRGFTFGIDWMTSMNASGGFTFPWLLDFLRGAIVGGHAIAGVGYDLKYETKNLGVVEKNWLEELIDKILKFYIEKKYGKPLGWAEFEEVIECQNSYSAKYGKNGRMYIRTSDFEKQVTKYGSFTNLDLPKDIAKWLNQFNGKPVKDILNPIDAKKADVYLIKDGKKCRFPKPATMYVWGFADEDIVEDEGMLREIPTGEEMNFWEGPSVKAVKMLILRAPFLKQIFQEEFTELFK